MPLKDERHSGCPTYPMYTLGLGGYILKTRQLREPPCTSFCIHADTLVLYPNGSSRWPTISFVPTPCWRDPDSWPTDHSGKSAIKGSCLAPSQNWVTSWAQGIAVNTQAEFLSVCICLHFVDSSFKKSVRWSNWIIFSFSPLIFDQFNEGLRLICSHLLSILPKEPTERRAEFPDFCMLSFCGRNGSI